MIWWIYLYNEPNLLAITKYLCYSLHVEIRLDPFFLVRLHLILIYYKIIAVAEIVGLQWQLSLASAEYKRPSPPQRLWETRAELPALRSRIYGSLLWLFFLNILSFWLFYKDGFMRRLTFCWKLFILACQLLQSHIASHSCWRQQMN